MATATIKKRAGDWFAETESVTLVLTAEEAGALLLVVKTVGGSAFLSPRGLLDAIELALIHEASMPLISADLNGSVCFRHGHVRDYFL